MNILELEPGWGIERYYTGYHGAHRIAYGVRHKHDKGWRIAVGMPKRCGLCDAVAPDAVTAWLDVCRWNR